MDLYGWDVVYACSSDFLNVQLAADPDGFAKSFSYSDSAIAVDGTFGTWRIVPGGAGTILRFELPIVTGKVVIVESGTSVPLDGAVPLVEMQLAFGDTNTTGAPLTLNCTTVGKRPGDTTPGAVSVVDPDTTGTLAREPSGAVAAALLVAGLSNTLIAHASALNFVFASLLPAPSTDVAWLRPARQAYCYQQPSGGSLGGMAILGVLDDRDITDLPRNYDGKLLAGSDFGYVLAGNQYLRNIVVPALPGAYGGSASPGNFRVTGETIGLASGFSLNSVRVGLINYTPEVTSFSMEIQDTRMQCYLDSTTDITGLIDAYVTNSVTAHNESHFDPTARKLSFLSDPKKSVTSDKHIPWWEEFIGTLTLGIMNAVIDGISLAIEDAAADAVASKDASALGQIGPGLVTWHGQPTLTITGGGLEDNIYMVGTLK